MILFIFQGRDQTFSASIPPPSEKVSEKVSENFSENSKELIAFVQDNIQKSPEFYKPGKHVQSLNFQGQKIWVKKVDPRKQGLWHYIRNRILRLICISNVYAPSVAYDNESLDIEAKRLRYCAQKQGPCVRFLARQDDWLVISDGGEPLEVVLRKLSESDPSSMILLLKKSLDTLLNLHQQGIVHGRSDIRDITVNNQGNIIFIDLAENPEYWMSWDECRVRDILSLFQSSLAFTQFHPEAEEKWVSYFIESIPRDLLPLIQQTINPIVWISSVLTWCPWLETRLSKTIKRLIKAVKILKEKL